MRLGTTKRLEYVDTPAPADLAWCQARCCAMTSDRTRIVTAGWRTARWEKEGWTPPAPDLRT